MAVGDGRSPNPVWCFLLFVQSYPAVNGTILPTGCCVFGSGLAFQNCTIGYGVGVRPPYLPFEEPRQSWRALQNAFLFVIDIQNVERIWRITERSSPCSKHSAQHWRGKGIKEEGDAGAFGERDLDGITAEHSHGSDCAPRGTPQCHVPAADARQQRVHLHSDNFAERIRRGQKHSAAHSCAEVHKGVIIERRDWPASPPSHEDALKDRGCDCVVSRYMAVMGATRAKMPAGDKSACADAKLQVEGMPNKAILDRKSWQGARLTLLRSDPAWCTNAHD